MVGETSIGGNARQFPQTRWSLICAAQEQPEARRAALGDLLSAYWKPLYFYVRRKGASVEEAKDLVQGFYLHLLETDFVLKPDPSRGKFRSFLRRCLDNFMAGEMERRAAKKRGGGIRTVSLDFGAAETEIGETPDSPLAAFEREWALGVMERSLRRLEGEFRSGLREGPFEAIRRSFQADCPISYEESARQHHLTISQFKSLLHRTRKRFRQILREEVSETLGSGDDAEDEIGALFRALQQS